MAGRIFVIGDTHGYADKLDKLLETIKPVAEDELIFLGDYIDRGPDSWGVLQRVYKLACELPRVVCLKGNHEAMLFDKLQWQSDLAYLLMADASEHYKGDIAIAQLQQVARQEPELLQEILHWLVKLPSHYERQGVHFAHAGCNPAYPLTEQTDEDFLWVRAEFYEKYRGKELWIVGHTPVQYLFGKEAEPYPLTRENNVIMLDTGVFMQGGRLSCLELTSGEIYQA